MNRVKVILAVLILASLLTGCAGAALTPGEEFNRLAAQAEKEIRLAERVGFLWRDTERLLYDARQAQAVGDHERAMRLADLALQQARLAQVQARDNANAAPKFPAN